MKSPRTPTAAAWLMGFALAGCLSEPTSEPDLPALSPLDVVTDAGAPVAYAQFSAREAGGSWVRGSADVAGRIHMPEVQASSNVTVGAPGFASQTFPASSIPARVVLTPGEGTPGDGILRFLPAVNLRCPTDLFNQVRDQMDPMNCGRFGEPVLETTDDGKIWASATCCARAPPLWLSRDDGKTFESLAPEGTSWLRETGGVEGDLTVDAAGNVYYLDFDYVASFSANGQHRHTHRHLFNIDRPWIHGGARDTLYFLYNSGGTQFFVSRDAGATWNRLEGRSFPCPLGAFGQGPERDDLWVGAACGNTRDNQPFRAWDDANPRLWYTLDGGGTWKGPESIPLPDRIPERERNVFTYVIPVADAAGNVYAVYTHTLNEAGEVGVFVARRAPSGEWSSPFDVGVRGVNGLTWPVAGAKGELSIAFYHTDSADPDNDPSAAWNVMAAVSVNADSASPRFQLSLVDSEPSVTGAMNRLLGDFLQTDLTRDGRLAIVYGVLQGSAVQNRFAASAATLSPEP